MIQPLVFLASLALAVLVALAAGLAFPRYYRVLQGTSPWAVWVTMAVSAGAALSAPGSPTGWLPLDLLYRAAFGAAVVWAASKARRWAWLVAAAATVLADHGELIGLAAGAALGLALASTAARRPGRMVGAAAGLGVAQGLLRIRWPHPLGASAGVAAAVLVVLAVSHLSRLHPRRRRGYYLAGAGLGAATVAFAALYGASAWGARSDATRGLADAQAALTDVRNGHTTHAGAALGSARAAIQVVQDRLDAGWNRPAEAIPILAQNARAVNVVLDQARSVLAQAAGLLGATNIRALRVSQGTVDVARIAGLARPISESQASLQAASARLGDLRSPWLVSPLVRKVAQLRAKMTKVATEEDTLAAAAQTLPGILGQSGPRYWVLAVLDNSELRGGGGLMAEVGEMETDHGRIRLRSLEATSPDFMSQLPKGGATITGPADYLAQYGWLQPGAYPIDAFQSPDFPTDARVVEQIYRQTADPRVSGVIAVDPFGLAALLRLTGPVQVAGWPGPITAANAVPILLHQQYLSLSGTPRKDFLVALGHQVFHQLTTGSLPGPNQLESALGPAVAGQHIRLYSDNPTEEGFFSQVGISGAMPRLHGDFIEVDTENFSLDKDDWFLTRRLDYSVRVDQATGLETATATLTLTNSSPASGEPAYILGGSRTPPGYDEQWVHLYTPLALAGAVVGTRPASVQGASDLGRHVYSTYVTIPPGGSVTITYHLYGAPEGPGAYHLEVGYQPAPHPDQLSVDVTPTGTPAGATLASVPSVRRQVSLTRPWSLSVPLAGTR